jgi:hypothetical protein
MNRAFSNPPQTIWGYAVGNVAGAMELPCDRHIDSIAIICSLSKQLFPFAATGILKKF